MGKMSDVSDGYHTFEELYQHRAALTAAFCNLATLYPEEQVTVVKSKLHHDGTMFDNETFIVVITLPYDIGQVSYHYNVRLWDWFRDVKEVDRAPVYDGHTPEMTIERLIEWVQFQ